MKNLSGLLLAAALLTSTFAADFDRGWAYYQAGDFESARAEWEPLAEQGDAMAQFRLGTLYANGDGVAPDLQKALDLYRRAAAQGLPEAQHAMGFTYRVGNGVRRDFTEAAKWYALAADTGIGEAQYYVASFYAGGTGLEKDLQQAYKYFSLAAMHGIDEARLGLFECVDQMTRQELAEARRMTAEWRPRSSSEAQR